jgi:hypothetical protein
MVSMLSLFAPGLNSLHWAVLCVFAPAPNDVTLLLIQLEMES